MRKIELLSALLFSLSVNATLRADQYPAHSLYQINAKFIRSDNQEITLSFFQGKPVILAMIYVSCPKVCPITLGVMKQIEAGLPKARRKDVTFVLVSFDPYSDTPEVMSEFIRDKKLNKNWTVITGRDHDLRTLAATLEISYEKSSASDFLHSTGIFVVDSKGVLVKKYDPPTGKAQSAVEQLMQLLSAIQD